MSLTPEKAATLKDLLGGDDALFQSVVGQIASTDKAAQADGVAYKDAPAETITINGVVYAPVVATEKAAPPIEGSPEEEAAESPEEAAAEGDIADSGDTADENMLTPAEITAIAQQTAQTLLDALMPHLGIGQKMDEVKSLLGGMAGGYAKKDAELAEVKEELATVKAIVTDLSGTQPRIMQGGYRASQAAVTVTTDETKLKDAQPTADPVAAAFGSFMTDLGFGSPQQPQA